MEHRDKIDKVFDSADALEILSWVKVHAYVDDKFALALLDRFWTSDQEDERSLVEKCFMNPSYMEGQKYDWTAIELDLTKLMPMLEKTYKDGEFIRAAYLAGYIITFTCKAYREDFYTQYHERIRPVMDYVRRAVEIVRDVLIDGEELDEASKVGILSEIVKECEKVKDVPVFRIDRFLEEVYCMTMPMKMYVSYINKLLKRKRDFNRHFHVKNKAKCLLKNGCWVKAKAFLEKEIGDEAVRTFYVELLIEHGEFRRALEVAEDHNSSIYVKEWIARQIKILDLINDDELTLDFCHRHFMVSYYRWDYYKKLRNTVPEREWKEFLEALLHECDFNCDIDRAEIKIYIEECMLDRVYPYCEKSGVHSVIENLKNFRKYLSEEQQKSLARLYSDWVIERSKSEDINSRRDYRYIAHWVKDLADCSPVGNKEAKNLLSTLLSLHSNRPAMLGELRALHLKTN